MFVRTHEDVQKVRASIEGFKKLSDGLIKIGPINVVGLDGLLALIPIPGLGMAYSIIAGLIILFLGIRARISLPTLISCTLILAIDSGITTADEIVQIFPVLGPFIGIITGGADAAFQGHLYAGHMIQKEMDATLYVDNSFTSAREDGSHLANKDQVKRTKGLKRLVYLRG
jgi:hypothetical protein